MNQMLFKDYRKFLHLKEMFEHNFSCELLIDRTENVRIKKDSGTGQIDKSRL